MAETCARTGQDPEINKYGHGGRQSEMTGQRKPRRNAP